MKKLISLIMILAMVAVMAGCGNSSSGNGSSDVNTASLETIIDEILKKSPVEFDGEKMPINLEDKTEEGQWKIKSFTGLDDVSQIKEAVAFEPGMGSLAFSMVLVRVKDSADTGKVAEAMKKGIDPAKWVCVSADDVKVAGYGDIVMFIMLDSGLEMEAQNFVDAFQKVCGSKPDFTL